MTGFEFTGLHFAWVIAMAGVLLLAAIQTERYAKYLLYALFVIFLIATPIKFTVDPKPVQNQQDSITKELHKHLPPRVIVEEEDYEDKMREKEQQLIEQGNKKFNNIMEGNLVAP